MTLRVFILAILGFVHSEGARILAFLPMGSHSHQNTYRPIFRELAKRGHDVTYYTTIPDENAPYKQIVLKDPFENITDQLDFYSLRKTNVLSQVITFTSLLEISMPLTLENPEVQQLIHSTENFDLVFTEATLFQEAYITLGHKFNAPVIELVGLCPTFWAYHLFGNPYSFSFTVDYNTVSSDKMNFLDRLKNLFKGIAILAFSRYYMLPMQQAIADDYFKYPGSESRPPLLDMLKNISLVLQNTHVATHYPHPYNPNIIEIAGMQLQEPKKLPKDLQAYLDNAKEGVIYFSLGSIVTGSLMPEGTKQSFLAAFRKLPYKVLWKWEADSLPDQPENVKISKWLPQKDILAHPNIKAFITHGGLASTTEAIYHGVPLVVIPLFSDQWKNSIKVREAGMGLILDFDNISEESITASLNKILKQPSFRDAAKRQSAILRDNPISPIDKAVFWVEYVLRHKGAPHLRTAGAGLPWYKYYLIDVATVIISSVFLIFFMLYRLLRTVRGLLIDRSEQKKVSKKKYK